MTYHYAIVALATTLAASTFLADDWRGQRAAQPAFATEQTRSGATPGRGFTTAFGEGAALRNLLF